MSYEEFTVKVLDKLGWDYDKVANPGHYKNTEDLLIGDLIFAIFSTDNTPSAAEMCGVSYKTVLTAIKRILVPEFGSLNGGGETWKFRLEHYLQVHKCPSCRIYKKYSDYHLNKGNPRGINNECKECRTHSNALTYKKDSTKKAHQRSYERHSDKIRERHIYQKVERARRVPLWSEKDKIVEFYKNCPKDKQVDHIIPLKGKLVSGLHVINNLQYLSPEDNMRKSNKYIIE